MARVVLLRHGQSTWNRDNRFTGWTDVDLTEEGIEEAETAAALLQEEGFTFDVAYTSVLKRAIRTLWIVQDRMDLMWIPVVRSWRLNERHYGDLQGLNKAETAERHGEEQVKIWRRSYATRPPQMDPKDERHPSHDRRYEELDEGDVPSGESLSDTVERVLPYWRETICPEISAGRRVLISAHGNSLRGLVKHLDGMSDDEVVGLNIPTGIPLVYALDDRLRSRGRRYLGDADAAEAAAREVGRQGRAPDGGEKG